MGQQEILDILNKHTTPLTGQEISKLLHISQPSTDASLRRLRRAKMVTYALESRKMSNNNGTYNVYVYTAKTSGSSP